MHLSLNIKSVSATAITVLALVCTDAAQAEVKAVRIVSGLARPVFVTAPPGDADRIFIVEQKSGSTGRVRIFKNDTLLPTPFLTVSGLTTANEQGLLGLAFHPDYANNRKFYVYYTTTGGGPAGQSVVEEYQASVADPDVADPATARTILHFDQPQDNHNAGWIGFGPNDGYLYIATGDGGGGGDDDAGHTAGIGNGQDITENWLGKILRIDVDGDDFVEADRNYAVPADNPFADAPDGSPVTGDDEIWAYGLRNPYRCSFDRANGDLLIADVGQSAWEEVNYQPAGAPGGENYGWRLKEATHCFNPSSNCDPGGLTEPIYEYGHNSNTNNAFSCGNPPVLPLGCSITGGYVYRGVIPSLAGRYFFADYCSDRIVSFEIVGGAAVNCLDHTVEFDPGGGLDLDSISSFGEDDAGELYICDLQDGEVFKIVEDADGDGVSDSVDNCPATPNPDQANNEGDADGDACDDDDDNDTVLDGDDNCPFDSNLDQADNDADGVGDACDLCPDTSVTLPVDADGCPLPIPGDADGDLDVDQEDFGTFQECLSGSGVEQDDPGCVSAKLDGDQDVDQDDFDIFAACMTGADVQGHPNCAP